MTSPTPLDMPKRIQRKRTKGWKMPEGAVYVGRGSKWGNPFKVSDMGIAESVLRFVTQIVPALPVTELKGKDLACWCALDAPCHADILLEAANTPLER